MKLLRRYWLLVIAAYIAFQVIAGPLLFAANVYLWGVVGQLMAHR